MARLARDSDGSLPAYAWPGGYPIVYLMADGETICAVCANGGNGSIATDTPDECTEKWWRIVGADIHWEGEAETCAHCGAETASAYGNPDAGSGAA